MLISTALASMILVGAPQGSCSSSKTAHTVAAMEKNIVETAVAAGSFKTLAAALTAGDLVDALQGDGPFTVFAPTDEAFAKLPEHQLAMLLKPENKALLQSILTYHVVPARLDANHVVQMPAAATLNGQRIDIAVTDGGVTVESAQVVKTDIACSNGIIHVIDTVMLPNSMNLVETAVEAGSFKTLAAALKAAELATALQGEGPFTVFAPSDDAFAKLPEGTVASLLEPENRDKLVSILKLHVVPGRVYADQVAKGEDLASLQGQHLRAKVNGDAVLVNGAKVLATDIDASNGVIHVIDTVLLPQ